MIVKNKAKKGPPFEPDKETPAKPDPNPDPTRIEPDPIKPVTPPIKTPGKPNTPTEPDK